MIHLLKIDGEGEFFVHRFDFHYMTDHHDGIPAEHGSVGSFDFEVHVDSQDKNGGNYKKARSTCWKLAVNASKANQEKIRKKFTLTAESKAGLDGGQRKIEFEGWISGYSESTATEAGKGGRDVIHCRAVVRPKDTKESYEPSLT